jgi:hypothetical protein
LRAVEEDCADGEKRHQAEPGDEGADAEQVLLLLDEGERAADEDEAGVGTVDALGDGGDADAGAGLPGDFVDWVRAQVGEDSGRRRGDGVVEVAGGVDGGAVGVVEDDEGLEAGGEVDVSGGSGYEPGPPGNASPWACMRLACALAVAAAAFAKADATLAEGDATGELGLAAGFGMEAMAEA